MKTRSFLRFGTPCLEHPPAPGERGPAERVAAGGPVTLLHPRPAEARAVPAVKLGDAVKAGQPLALYGGPDYVTAPVAGQIAALRPVSGSFGRSSTAVTIEPAADPADVGGGRVRLGRWMIEWLLVFQPINAGRPGRWPV